MLFLHWAANTLLQASAFMRSPLPFNLIAASFCLLTSLWLLSAFGVTKDSSASSFFISPPGGDRQAFFGNYVGDVPLLDFKFKFQEFNDKTNSQVQVFLMWVTGQKLLASEQSNIQLFSRTFWYLETGQEIHQLKKIQWITIKVRANIYLLLLFFLGMAFLFFL